MVIQGPDGVAYEPPAANALRDFWGVRLEAAHGIANDEAEFLSFVETSSIPAEPLTSDEFEGVLLASPNSAPGPDGLCFSCWSCTGCCGARILHDCYWALASGETFPPEFNVADMALFRKTSPVNGRTMLRAVRGDLRPLTLFIT